MVRAGVSEVKTPMRDDLKPYPKYREVHLPWIISIPTHWECLPLNAVAQIRNETDRSDLGLLSVYLDRGVIPYSEGGGQVHSPSIDLSGYQVVKPGDFVLNNQQAWRGSVGVSRFSGIVSPAYVVLRLSENLNAIFANYLFRSAVMVDQFVIASRGVGTIQRNLYFPSLRRTTVLVPPLDEQAAIVHFLDYADRRIEQYIRAKRKLIKLLNEQKQSIIHQAVTRGLDPTVRLKPSGIAWLGNIPEHWEVWRISRFARVGNGSTPSRSNAEYWINGIYPWLNSSNVNRGFIDNANQFVTKIALDECHLPRVPPGSVLVAITGQGKTRGTAAVLGIEATINQHIAFITPRSAIIVPEFLQLALIGAYKTLRALSDDSGSTKGALTCEDLKKFKLAVPPEYEQRDLVARIKHATNDIDVVINRTQREIDLICEYRTRLIADVVTGKLDVREAAAKLPEEANDLQELSHNISDEEIEEIEAADDLSGEGDE